MFDGVVNVRCAQSSGHSSIRTIRLQMLINRSGTNGAATDTTISATILTSTDGTSNTAFSETGSAGTVNSISFSTLISGASQSSGTCQIRAITNTDSGSATSIDLVGFIYGRGDISFS